MRKPILNGILQSDLDAAGKQINRQRFTPEAYGAMADGVTDDSAAFSAAITDAIAAGHSQVELAKGKTYALKQSGVAQQVLISGGTPDTKLFFIGNGATIHYEGTIGGYYPACFQIQTEFHTIHFEGINFIRPRQQLGYINACINVNRVRGSTAVSSMIRVRDCYFENSPRALWVGQGYSSAKARFTLKRVEFIENRVEHPWACDAGAATTAPQVGCYASWWADTMWVDGNYFDGGPDVTFTPSGNHQMDGLAISEAKHTFFRRNTVRNVKFEGGILQVPQGQIGVNLTAFNMPNVGSTVTITYAISEPEDETEYLKVGNIVFLRNSVSPYLVAGQFNIQAVDTTGKTLTLLNTGAPHNAAPTTSILPAQLGLVDTYSGEATAIYENNDLDQRIPVGGGFPTTVALITHNNGRGTIRSNTLRNVTTGIDVGPQGATEISQFPSVASDSSITNNEITFQDWVAGGPGNYQGIRVSSECDRVVIIGNIGHALTSTGLLFVGAYGGAAQIYDNAFKADSLVYNAAHLSVAYIHGNGTTGTVIDRNIAQNLDYAVCGQNLPTGGANDVMVGSLSTVNCTTRAVGNITYLPTYIDGVKVITKVKCSLHNLSAQSIPSGAPSSKLLFSQEEQDPSNVVSGSTFTAPRAGDYFIRGYAILQFTNASYSSLLIYKNGSLTTTFAATSNHIANQGLFGRVRLTLAANDTIELYCQQVSGSSGNFDTTNTGSFQIEEL